MRYRRLGTSGLSVSELALGTLTFGRETNADEAARILSVYLDAGGNLLDTANVYSAAISDDVRHDPRALARAGLRNEEVAREGSEELIGRCLSAARRDEVVLATKVGLATGPGENDRGASRRHVTLALEASLRRMKTEWIDLYQLHAPDPATPVEETLAALHDHVRAGKIRYVGVSNHAGWQVAKMLGIAREMGGPPIVSVQSQYSLLARGAELEVLPVCESEDLAFLAWGPLAGGVLTGKYLAPREGVARADEEQSKRVMQKRLDEANREIAHLVHTVAAELGCPSAHVALQWVLSSRNVTSAVVGARTALQLKENLAAVEVALPADSEQKLSRATRLWLEHPYDFHHMLGQRSVR